MDTMDVVYPVDFEIVLKAYLTFHTHDLNQAYLHFQVKKEIDCFLEPS